MQTEFGPLACFDEHSRRGIHSLQQRRAELANIDQSRWNLDRGAPLVIHFLSTVRNAVCAAIQAGLLMVVQTCAGTPHFTAKLVYLPYVYIDIAVAPEAAAPVFDVLTHALRQSGSLAMDDDLTAMGVNLYGESNPARFNLKYNMKDESKVSLGILRNLPTSDNVPRDPAVAYLPRNEKTPYDGSKTYVILTLGYGSEGVAKAIVSRKIIDLVKLANYECLAARMACTIRARFPVSPYPPLPSTH